MNQLTKYLISELLDGKTVTAVYGGGFKPPTKGHFDLVKKALDDYKEIDKFIIYVGGGVRDGITQEQSMQIWQMYKEILGNKVEIVPSKNPIGDVLRYAKNNTEEKVYFVIGYREGREDDLADVAQRTAGVEEKYPNTEVKLVMTPGGEMSGTNARKALKSGNKEEFFTYLPDKVPATEKESIWDLLNDALVKENDPKVGTGKKPKGSGRRLYTDEDPTDTVAIKFSSKQDIIDTLSKTSFKSKPHNRQSQIINVIHQRVRAAYERAKDPEVKARLKKALEYAEQRKEASKEKTERLKKQNLNEQKQDMKFKVPKLNYSYTSLQPYIDKETMEEHFDKHFKGYTDKLNAELDEKSIRVNAKDQIQAIQIILGKYSKNDVVRNNGGGFYNHVLYFENMTPDYKAPSAKFRKMLEENFNSFSEFKEQFKEAGLKQFGSGWVFLIKKGDKLVIESYANQDNPYLDKNFKGEILIAMDVWEHSYYLKHKSQRGKYIDDFFRVVDYKVAEDRLKEESITENVAPNHDGKSAPFGSGYKTVKERTAFGNPPRYRAIEKRGDKYYYIQDNPFAPGIRQEFGPYKTKEQAKRKMGTFPPSQNYRDITEIGVDLSNYSGQVLQGDVVRAPKGFPLGGKKLEKSLELKVKKISREGVNRYKLSLEDSDGKNYTVRNYQMDGEYKGEKLPKWGLVRKSKENVNENTIPSIDIAQKCAELTKHMIDKGYNIQPLPAVKFIGDDTSNAEDFLGKTAYYDPQEKMIVLYTYGRHPKDIARSFAHEMIHHMQNLEGRLDNITTTDTTEDANLNDLEKEANLLGTMTFRNYTDGLQKTQVNETMTVYRLGEIPYDEDSFFVTPDYRTWAKFYPNEEIHKITTNKLYLPLVNKSFSSFDELRSKYESGEFTDDDVAYINPEESGIQNFEQYEIKPEDIIDLEQINEQKKKNKDPFGLNQYARELAQGLE